MWKTIKRDELSNWVPALCRTPNALIEYINIRTLRIFINEDEKKGYKGCKALLDSIIIRKTELITYLKRFPTKGFCMQESGLALGLKEPILNLSCDIKIRVHEDDLYLIHAAVHCCPKVDIEMLAVILKAYYKKNEEEVRKVFKL